jgi:hypothetical protein
MRNFLESFGLDNIRQERELKKQKDALEQARKINDVREKAIKEEERTNNLITSEIDYLTSEVEEIEDKIRNIIEPVSIIVNTDMVSASEEYYDVRKDTDKLRKEVASSGEEMMTYSYLSILKLGLSSLIVFIATRIMSGNSEFSKTIKAAEIAKHIFTSIGTKSALMLDLYLQDTLMIAAIGSAIGTMYYKFPKFRSKDAILYATVGLIYSLCLMQLGSIFNSL